MCARACVYRLVSLPNAISTFMDYFVPKRSM